jgi:hypothetical protein
VLQKGRARKHESRDSYRRMAPWLQLANLLPPPPPRDQQNEASGLVASLQINLWKASSNMEPGDLVVRFATSSLSQTSPFSDSIDLRSLRALPEHAHQFLEMVREVASTLDSLCRTSAPYVLKAAGEQALMVKRLFVTPSMSRSEIWIRQGMVSTYGIDPFKDFLTALHGTPVGRIRRCPICYRFFFGLRKDQKACTKRCNALRRVREWRTKQSQHEYRRKLRSAGLSASRQSPQR